jgi:hypothetical protein
MHHNRRHCIRMLYEDILIGLVSWEHNGPQLDVVVFAAKQWPSNTSLTPEQFRGRCWQLRPDQARGRARSPSVERNTILTQDLTIGFGTLLYLTCRQSKSGFESYDSLSIDPSDGSATLIRILLASLFCFPSTLLHLTLHVPSILTSTIILLPSISIRRHLPVFNSPF